MQFALPPRKPSHHVPYTRLSHSLIARRRKLKAGAILAFIAFSFLFLFSRLFSPSSLPVSSGEVVPAGVTNIVIVTVLDEDSLSDKYIQRIKQNREDYAKRHGKINAKHLLAVNGSLLIKDFKKNRLHELFRKHQRIPSLPERRTSQLGSNPSSPPCLHLVSEGVSLLPSLPARCHHEPFSLSDLPHPR